ncbi:predicted protein [Uncinocarpus reesii 1704]|uniref:Xylanolytic transcriptional activator regulatory domain-containing protein n=1 Tax=Uncinocarpus reesii (strain UAMH 1704) TaxID=336963 RepID=C4JFV9_UNCRE|nr:uncharacterized protein UREG_01039 [Uncinocarpus reesii 1704]EEP76190.1 predicted protein [Uncinocarpus reesii 1704]
MDVDMIHSQQLPVEHELWFQHTDAAAGRPDIPFPVDLPDDFTRWAMETGDIISFPESNFKDPTFPLPAGLEPHSEHWPPASLPNLDSSESALSLTTSSPFSHYDGVADLHRYLSENAGATKRLVQLYFADVHPFWPILHEPTFDAGNTPDLLLASMAMLASWVKHELDCLRLGPLVFEAISAIRVSTDGMAARALHFNSVLVSTCRHQGIFSGQFAQHSPDDSPFAYWLAQEQQNRLAFSVLRLDAYLSVLTDHPPSVRYQEICIPLPKSARLWSAASEDERSNLQWKEPAGREKVPFFFLIRDALDVGGRQQLPYPLNEADYHLGLCSLQAGIWDAAREAHSSAADELVVKSNAVDPIRLWRSHLNLWRASMEKDCQLRGHYFSGATLSADQIFTPILLILWHLSALNMHAPLDLLQGRGYSFKSPPGTAMTTVKTKAHLRTWMSSLCPRTAVWNAAQISRVFAQESQTPVPSESMMLNPLAMPALLKSAIVTCSYAFNTRTCAACIGVPCVDAVDLFSADDDDERLVRWKQHGEPSRPGARARSWCVSVISNHWRCGFKSFLFEISAPPWSSCRFWDSRFG